MPILYKNIKKWVAAYFIRGFLSLWSIFLLTPIRIHYVISLFPAYLEIIKLT